MMCSVSVRANEEIRRSSAAGSPFSYGMMGVGLDELNAHVFSERYLIL